MKLYVKLFLLIFGTFILASCASHPSEVMQKTSTPSSIEEQAVENKPLEKSVVAEITPELRDEEIICKAITKTGSRLPKREVCATRKQWADSAKAPREQWKSELEQARYSS